MKAALIIIYILISDPTVSLQKIVFHKSREVCEIQEGVFNQDVTAQAYGRNSQIVKLKGSEFMFEFAECHDLPER